MRRACREERPVEEVEEEEEAERAILGEDIPLKDMLPPTEEAAPQEIADEQPEGVSVAAVNPEGMIGSRQPIYLAEAENRPFHQKGRCLAGEAERESTERQLDEAYPKQMKKCVIMIMLAILLFIIIGIVLSNTLRTRTQNATTPVTDMDFSVTTPMTTSIFRRFNVCDMDI